MLVSAPLVCLVYVGSYSYFSLQRKISTENICMAVKIQVFSPHTGVRDNSDKQSNLSTMDTFGTKKSHSCWDVAVKHGGQGWQGGRGGRGGRGGGMKLCDLLLYNMGICIQHSSVIDNWPLWRSYFGSLGHILVAVAIVERWLLQRG